MFLQHTKCFEEHSPGDVARLPLNGGFATGVISFVRQLEFWVLNLLVRKDFPLPPLALGKAPVGKAPLGKASLVKDSPQRSARWSELL